MYPELVRRKIGQLSFNYFMFICLIGQRCLILVSSEDMPTIPMDLYEPRFLGDSADAQIAGSYKRGGSSTAFYGLRGKKQSDAAEIIENDDKRGAFYPVRGKKPTAFTALRGKKMLNNIENEFSSSNNNSTLSHFLTNLKNNNNAWDSDVAKLEAILNERMKQPDHSLNAHSQTSDNYADSLEDVTHKGKIMYSPMEEKQENNPWTESTKFFTESLKGSSADDLTNNDDDNDSGAKEIPIDKRRTSGFIPMRGRKSDSDETEARSVADKRRTSSGFIPMRGRKFDSDEAQFFENKRRTSGFFPMRGRKFDSDEEDDAQFFADKRRTSGFIPMRGRKFDSDEAQVFENKRRTSGFIPMRGRKSGYDEAQFFEDFNKRRTSGFIPMRGRKSEADDVFFEDKKKSAFIPMRGRKSEADAMFFADKKKSAFIPMRGRRIDDNDEKSSSSNENAEFSENRYNFAPLIRSRRSIWNQDGVDNFGQRQTTGNEGWISYSKWPLSQDKRVAFHAVRGKKYSLPVNWNYLKRAFHASRVKNFDDVESGSRDDASKYFNSSGEKNPNPENRISAFRIKRSMQQKMSRGRSRSTIAIKRPITFFATRGKRFDDNTMEPSSSYLLV